MWHVPGESCELSDWGIVEVNGVIYSLSGPAYAELLTVSLWTLRRHYWGDVAIVCSGPQCREAMEPLAEEPRLAPVRLIDHELPPVRRHAQYCVKPSVALASPFDRTVFLDADTIVLGPIDELFHAPLTVTQFSNWITTGRIIGGRIRQWMEPFYPELPHDTAIQPGMVISWSLKGAPKFKARVLEIEPKRGDMPREAKLVDAVAHELARRQLELPRPAINTGVFAFSTEARSALAAWEALTLRNWQRSFTDELAMQLVWQYAGARLLNDRWNWSVQFGQAPDPVVMHFHGRKHVRGHAAKWMPHYDEARREDVAGIASWGGRWDKAVANYDQRL